MTDEEKILVLNLVVQDARQDRSVVRDEISPYCFSLIEYFTNYFRKCANIYIRLFTCWYVEKTYGIVSHQSIFGYKFELK